MYSRVLVVENDPDIVEILKTNLLQHGFTVQVATNGRTGLEMARSENFDVAILDIMLPELDGLELCRALRERSKSMAILLLTGRSGEVDRIVGLEIGADDYITKPFNVRELIARIKAKPGDRRISARCRRNSSECVDVPKECRSN